LRARSERNFDRSVAGVFTRGEEVGFIGAIHLARSKLLPPDATVISVCRALYCPRQLP
jgi:hypothetical protein